MAFLPISREEMRKKGWDQADFVLITGEAYIDHPSFGHAIISRVLESHGYRVAILAQPDWRSVKDFKRFGKPRLGFLISSGNVDSMVNNYSVFKRKRKKDSYSPGGQAGNRPDRAVIVYSNRAREAYKDVPIIIGGIEASLRRLAHYDYWDDRVRRSILMDSRADLLIYGMGERTIIEVAEALESGISIKDISWIRGTAYRAKLEEDLLKGVDFQLLPSYQEVVNSKYKYAESFKIQYRNNDHIIGKTLIEPYNDYAVIVNPPSEPLNSIELNDVYELPYERTYHPIYEKLGGVPAIEEVKFSIAANRGCFGGCAFCAITYHQGRSVQGRSKESIVKEAELLTKREDFKGYIHDIGGPTANFRNVACNKQLGSGICVNKDCLFPEPCKNLIVDHEEYIDILRTVRKLPGIKKVFIRSGIRYDYVRQDKNSNFLEEICKHHISGTLKVAPEHVSDRVLKRMRKPPIKVFEEFAEQYKGINERIGKKQYLIPYLISSHPGSTLEDAIELALYLKKNRFVPDQVQDFYPTPGTLSTCMYYTGLDPLTGEKVYVARDIKEKSLQRALLQFNKKENRKLVKEALTIAGREDLINVLR
ncbi:MAG: YgiQ family radical SAM protein [Clostridiales bacterium]|nr:YgiQ family radical SAM protein [Clostridiales bacterium]